MRYPQPVSTEVVPILSKMFSKRREWLILRVWEGRDHLACKRCPQCLAVEGPVPATMQCTVLCRRRVRGEAARDFTVREDLGEAPMLTGSA